MAANRRKWHKGTEKPQEDGIYECDWKDGIGIGGRWFNGFRNGAWHDGAILPWAFLAERDDPLGEAHERELVKWRGPVIPKQTQNLNSTTPPDAY